MKQFFIKLGCASKNSLKGFKNAWKGEWAFRVELIIFIIAAPMACYLGRTAVERSLMISSLLLVLILELINSAIEATVNRIGFEFHELSGLAKDLASAAIFVGCLNVLVTWGIILIS